MRAATHAEPGFIALEGGDARAEVVPTEGGRLRALHLFGREWLLSGPSAPARSTEHPAAGYGWQECAPCAGGGEMPRWVKGAGGVLFPVGGETRGSVPETAVVTDAEGHKVASTWRGTRAPWVLTRTLLVRADGGVELRYEALTAGPERFPFLWSAWLAMPMSPDTRLQLPDGARTRFSAVRGCEVGADDEAGRARWPRATIGGRPRDLSTPWELPRGAQLTAWLDMAPGRSQVHVLEDDARLTLGFDGGAIPVLGVATDRSGTTRGRRSGLRRATRPALSVVLSLGAPDVYATALGDWQSMAWLVPGEPRRWTVTIRGGSA